MQNSIPTWQLSPTAALIRLDDQWLLEDPRHGRFRQLHNITEWLAELFAALVAAGPVSSLHLRGLTRRAGVPANRVDACIASLHQADLLVPHGAGHLDRDASAQRDHQWVMVASPVDYAQPGVIDDDLRTMDEYAAQGPPPAAYVHPGDGEPSIPLPHPLLDPPEHPLHSLGHLLYFTHAVLSDAVIGPLPRSRRVTPSHGAAHPFDLTVTTDHLSGCTHQNYCYAPGAHALVPADQTHSVAASFVPQAKDLLITVHLASDRVQWRYRASTAYPTIFLDLGHLLETLRMTAAFLRMTVEELPLPDGPPLTPVHTRFGPVLARCVLRRANAGAS